MSNENADFVYGINAVEAILEQRASSVEALYLGGKRDDKRHNNLIRAAQASNVNISRVDAQAFERLLVQAGLDAASVHQQVLARVRPAEVQDENFLKTLLKRLEVPALLLVLDGVTDPHNLGACMRSANAAGAQAVVVPRDNAVHLTAAVRKVASGAAELTPLVVVKNLARCIESLQQAGVWVMGAAGGTGQSLYQLDLTVHTALVLGAEGAGLRRLTRERCDALFEIPMAGEVESLNVSVAAGVSLFEALRQRRFL
ncbi:MAG: 23S rRNA (guanosine(2251)-2'-O)-methyltransferase RlmB [Gammaproteobacteria bacterium]|nr:23S rRNA (guanosine(2251)-2'-O)-methyltransferase RlmB [Gammaproteobacteria bacterium]NND39362.1 23S rRNA (guanosine(2251)-2'-O)-methyltransferase RlmB [Pseudomonadales bacterium]MBT8151310.1 23S rRNA (guanosine(2251)-2'-O)-methyltransferase RlmB [Gammaproteobacteria bacterium]NNL11928.1 23S rRNA (guanosine(2251)-2'-O)-methyltransferase RlmB [Pseudomonadales bacterium]NNM10509.1 23S rRNA (guanosine(2251)-2'-O)-methyltransferase RlmB [Pseudomonadales bacterium]